MLGDDARLFARYYDVTAGGNWEGHNILHVNVDLETLAEEFGLGQSRRCAAPRRRPPRSSLTARAERVWPGLDDKVLTAWNGLMLAAFAEGGSNPAAPGLHARC